MRLQVLYQHAPTSGAPGIYRHRMLLGELARRGWTVDVVSSPINYMHGTVPAEYSGRDRITTEVIDGVTHHWVRATGGVHRSFRRRALNYLTFMTTAAVRGATLPRPDVVWASSPPLSVATAGRFVARRHRVPWVLEVRDLWPESAAAVGLLGEQSRAYRMLDRAARTYARSAASVLVPTPGLVDLVRGHGARRVDVVTGAITDAPRDDARSAATRSRLGLAPDACVFAYVGAHGVVNGLDVLLDAADLLVQRDPDAAARIAIVTAGSGSAYDALVDRLAMAPNPLVQLLGPVSKDDARDLVGAADVGLHMLRPDPVFESALPTKVLEYVGCHVPFITTVPGLPAAIARETGGDVVADADALAAALAAWAELPVDERRRRGERAFAWGERNHGLSSTTDTLEQLLHAAITTSV